MVNIHESFVNSLAEAKVVLAKADHLAYVTYPVVKDSKLLIRSLEHCHKAAICIISLILKYEYLHRRIILTKNHERNLEIFFKKCSQRYNLTENEKETLKYLFKTAKEHEKSGMEFPHKNKVIIFIEEGEIEELSEEQVKSCIKTLNTLIQSTQNKLMNF